MNAFDIQRGRKKIYSSGTEFMPQKKIHVDAIWHESSQTNPGQLFMKYKEGEKKGNSSGQLYRSREQAGLCFVCVVRTESEVLDQS